MLREGKGARRYVESVTLLHSETKVDEFGHVSTGEPKAVCRTFASVTRMSAQRAMLTFQQADVIGLDIEMRNPCVKFNSISWKGHRVFIEAPEDVGNRGRILKISGYYQEDRR